MNTSYKPASAWVLFFPLHCEVSFIIHHSIVQGLDLTPGSKGGFRKPQSILALIPGMTNTPRLSCGSEGSAEALRLVQFRIFCSECEPKAILGQIKDPHFLWISLHEGIL